MFCSQCGTHAEDGTRFCQNCGASFQASNTYNRPPAENLARGGSRRASPSTQDPYKDQIQQTKLELRQLKLDLKQITTQMSSIRSRYYETAAFVPRGLLRWGDKAIEDFRLLGPQQQKERLQQHIMQLERELLALQQSQAQWKAQQ